jgi:hypothetical protein
MWINGFSSFKVIIMWITSKDMVNKVIEHLSYEEFLCYSIYLYPTLIEGIIIKQKYPIFYIDEEVIGS